MVFAYYDSQDDLPLNQLPPYDPKALTLTQKQEELEKVKHIILYDLDWEAKLAPNPFTAPTYGRYCELYGDIPPSLMTTHMTESSCYWPCYARLYCDTKDPQEILRLFPNVQILCTMQPNNNTQTLHNEMLCIFDLFVESTFLMLKASNENEDEDWKHSLKTVSNMARMWLNEARKSSSSSLHKTKEDEYMKLP